MLQPGKEWAVDAREDEGDELVLRPDKARVVGAREVEVEPRSPGQELVLQPRKEQVVDAREVEAEQRLPAPQEEVDRLVPPQAPQPQHTSRDRSATLPPLEPHGSTKACRSTASRLQA